MQRSVTSACKLCKRVTSSSRVSGISLELGRRSAFNLRPDRQDLLSAFAFMANVGLKSVSRMPSVKKFVKSCWLALLTSQACLLAEQPR